MQHDQTQMCIDKSKGIVAKSMPRSWHDRYAAGAIEDESLRPIYRAIVADKKPYFMRYIYAPLMKQYNTYIKNTNRNALREFQMTVDEIKATPESEMTDRQKEFLKYFEYCMPVGMGNCVMNRICRKFEDVFDGYVAKNKDESFDYTIMKSGTPYSARQFNGIKELYSEFNKRLKSYILFAGSDKVDESEFTSNIVDLQEEFKTRCAQVCPNRFALCDIVLDICYTKNATKKFAWNMCSSEIIENLLSKNNNIISWPELCADGDIEYGGCRYAVKSAVIGTEESE